MVLALRVCAGDHGSGFTIPGSDFGGLGLLAVFANSEMQVLGEFWSFWRLGYRIAIWMNCDRTQNGNQDCLGFQLAYC